MGRIVGRTRLSHLRQGTGIPPQNRRSALFARYVTEHDTPSLFSILGPFAMLTYAS